MRRALLAVVVALCALGCGGGERPADDGGATSGGDTGTGTATAGAASAGATTATTGGRRHPDILEVALEPAGGGRYDVAVTVSSPYDTPQRYADGWRVLAPDGRELGSHTLMHDHAGEQPFTRTQSGLEVPDDVSEVTVEGHDQANGYGGATVTVDVPR